MAPAKERDPVEAARLLREGHVVSYMPGDATRYECVLLQVPGAPAPRFLGLANFGIILPQPFEDGRRVGLAHWAHAIPRGSWAGLRPLLAALGWAHGDAVYDPDDSSREHDDRAGLRARTDRGADPSGSEALADGRLGFVVRELLEARGYVVPRGDGGTYRGVVLPDAVAGGRLVIELLGAEAPAENEHVVIRVVDP